MAEKPQEAFKKLLLRDLEAGIEHNKEDIVYVRDELALAFKLGDKTIRIAKEIKMLKAEINNINI